MACKETAMAAALQLRAAFSSSPCSYQIIYVIRYNSTFCINRMHPINVPDLSARQLHAVLAVAEYNSFIAAAAFLKTSQPALTRTIQRVEDVLGVRLFDRSTRRIEITAAGREFVAVAERMLNDLRISMSSMREIGTEQRGQVILSSIMAAPSGTLPGSI